MMKEINELTVKVEQIDYLEIEVNGYLENGYEIVKKSEATKKVIFKTPQGQETFYFRLK